MKASDICSEALGCRRGCSVLSPPRGKSKAHTRHSWDRRCFQGWCEFAELVRDVDMQTTAKWGGRTLYREEKIALCYI